MSDGAAREWRFYLARTLILILRGWVLNVAIWKAWAERTQITAQCVACHAGYRLK